MHVGEWIVHWISTVPPLVVYLSLAGIVMVESVGIPMPGEVALVGASMLTLHPGSHVHWQWVAVCAAAGAIVGDSIGYTIGRRGGRPLLAWMGSRFPKHFGPAHLASAERMFDRWGMWAVFFGRFVLLLRVLAGPLSGALRMRYPRFVLANALGGIVWAGGTAALIHFVGAVVERWLSGIAFWGFVVAVVGGIVTTVVITRRAGRTQPADADPEPGTAADRAA